jgi:hypothetical protein
MEDKIIFDGQNYFLTDRFIFEVVRHIGGRLEINLERKGVRIRCPRLGP